MCCDIPTPWVSEQSIHIYVSLCVQTHCGHADATTSVVQCSAV